MKDDDPGEQWWLDNFYNGKNDAIGDWYMEYNLELHHVAYRYLRDTALAWDAVHDIFEKLIRYTKTQRIEKFKVKSSIFNSLKLRIRMHSIDIIRKKKRRVEVNIDNIFHLQLQDIDLHLQIELQDILKVAIETAKQNNLFNATQLLLLDYYLEGHDNQAIANELNIQKAKVAKEKFKLRRVLQRVLIELESAS